MAQSKDAVESATLETVGGKLTFGNSEGLSMTKQLDTIEKRLQAHEETLRDHAERLGITEPVCYGIRHRFIDTYRKKILRDSDIQLSARIEHGNRVAHGGNIIADSRLYKAGERTDVDVFRDIYQVSVEVALMLDPRKDRKVIEVLDHMASTRVEGTVIPDTMQEACDPLIDALHTSASDLDRVRDSLGVLCGNYYAAIIDIR